MLMLLAGSIGVGEREVLTNQDADAVQVVALVKQVLGPDDHIEAYLPADDFLAKYSAIAHRIAADRQPATFALYTDGTAAASAFDGEVIGRVGRYVIERIAP